MESARNTANLRQHHVAQLKRTSIKTLVVLFLNTSVWLGGTFLFMYLEGTNESAHKCGVKRVQRDFIDALWEETKSMDEHDWKSSARKKIINFEDQLHQAVEAGVSTYSGQKIWSLSNAFVYCFTLATTIGYGHLTPSSPWVRLVSILYGGIAAPLLAVLIGQISSFLSSLLAIMVLASKGNSEDSCGSAQPVNGLSATSMLTILVSYALGGSLIFSVVFLWDFTDSIYFVFSTLSTVGFGDIVPEDSLIFLMLGGYILIGLSVYSLWQESVVGNIEIQLEEMSSRLESHKQEADRRNVKEHIQ